MLLDHEKLESLLLANWTKFIQYRNLLKMLEELANRHLNGNWSIQKATFTRFEYIEDKFIAWIEYTAIQGIEKASLTSEFNITSNDFLHIRTVNS